MKKWTVVQEFKDEPRCNICHYYKPEEDEAMWHDGVCGVTGRPITMPWDRLDDCPLQEIKE
jgi:hypothetical protein